MRGQVVATRSGGAGAMKREIEDWAAAPQIELAIERAVVAGGFWADARRFPATAPIWEGVAQAESDIVTALLGDFTRSPAARMVVPE